MKLYACLPYEPKLILIIYIRVRLRVDIWFVFDLTKACEIQHRKHNYHQMHKAFRSSIVDPDLLNLMHTDPDPVQIQVNKIIKLISNIF